MLHQDITADWTQSANALATAYLAALETVPQLTNLSTSLVHAEQLARQVRRHAAENRAGMLGENGIAPAVRSCVEGARFHGFDWRERRL